MKQALTFLLAALCVGTAGANERTGWGDPDRAFETDPCAWAVHRILDLASETDLALGGEATTAEEIVEILARRDLIPRLARSVDHRARQMAGLGAPDDKAEHGVSWRDIPDFDPTEKFAEARRRLATQSVWVRNFIVDQYRNPESDAFPMLQYEMVAYRLTELRYETETQSPFAPNFFAGEPTARIDVIGDLLPELQHDQVRRLTPGVALFVIPPSYSNWADTPLRDRADIIRARLDDEFNPAAYNGQIHFNAREIRYSGMLETFKGGRATAVDSQLLGFMIDSALARPEAHAVTVGVDLERLYDGGFHQSLLRKMKSAEVAVEMSRMSVVLSAESVLMFNGNRNQRGETLPTFFRRELEGLALTLLENVETSPDAEVRSPEAPTSLNYQFTFERPDGKTVTVAFDGPPNSFERFRQSLAVEK